MRGESCSQQHETEVTGVGEGSWTPLCGQTQCIGAYSGRQQTLLPTGDFRGGTGCAKEIIGACVPPTSGFWRSQGQPSGISSSSVEEGMYERKCGGSLQPARPHLMDHSFSSERCPFLGSRSRILILFNYISASPLQDREILILHSTVVFLRRQ